MKRLPRVTRLTATALLASALIACGKPPPAAEPVRAVRTQVVALAPVGITHEYPAEVRARVESRLAFRVGGKITRRLVEVGERVRAGQPLAQLDPQDLNLAQDTARAGLAAARANLDIQQAEYQRYAELRDKGFISNLELERRAATLKAAKAQHDQASAQAGLQVNQAQYALLSADAPGLVVGVDAEAGAVVAAGTPVLRLARDGARDVVFSVPEERVAGVRALIGVADAVQVRWSALGADTATRPAQTATVREVAAAADPATRTFLVKADVGTTSASLGGTANVLIAPALGTSAIRLPLPAVLEHQGQSAVWLLDRGTMTVSLRPVQVAGADGNLLVIAAGLNPGQTVVTAGVHALTPGQKVALYAEPTGAAAPSPLPAASSAR